MPQFPIDSPRMRMDATGVVNRVMQWGQDAQGKRFKTETQDRDPDTGMLKYGVEVLYRDRTSVRTAPSPQSWRSGPPTSRTRCR